MNEKKMNKQTNNKANAKSKTSACGGKCKPQHHEENCK